MPECRWLLEVIDARYQDGDLSTVTSACTASSEVIRNQIYTVTDRRSILILERHGRHYGVAAQRLPWLKIVDARFAGGRSTL